MLDKMNALPHCPMLTKMRSSLRRTSLSLVALILAVAVIPYRNSSAQQAPATSPKRSASDPEAWDEAIRGIAHKHSLPKEDPRAQAAATQLESTAAAAMRAILSHPDFQASDPHALHVLYIAERESRNPTTA